MAQNNPRQPPLSNSHIEIEVENVPHLPYLSLTIGDRSVPAYVDTMANACFISREVVPANSHIDEQSHEVTLADGSTTTVEGDVEIPFNIGSVEFVQRLHVLKVAHRPILLGFN